MKTTISIPDALFTQAEEYARSNGTSRSKLYATALEAYLRARRDEAITEAINRICKTEDSTLDPAIALAQWQAIGREEW